MGFVDLHSHLLPGLDDGPEDMSAALDLAQMFVELGFDTVCATPHQRVDLFAPPMDAIQARTVEMNRITGAWQPPLKIIFGAENCWDGLLFERSQKQQIPCFGQSRAFLVEMAGPFLPPEVEQQLFEWRKQGFLPVLAHVERYVGTPGLMKRLETLSGMTVITCNLDSLGGRMGHRLTKLTRALVRAELVHALCTDLHGPTWVKATGKGIRWVQKKLGSAEAKKLLDENPRRVLAGAFPD
jgi:protein-tyrosine phosphatase